MTLTFSSNKRMITNIYKSIESDTVLAIKVDKNRECDSYLVTSEVIAFADTPQAAVHEGPVKKCDEDIALPFEVFAVQLEDELEAEFVSHFYSEKGRFFSKFKIQSK